jgi:hypothetical protein
MIQTLLTDGPDKAFRKGVHVWGTGNRGNTPDVVFFIREIVKLTGVVVDKIRAGILIFKGGKLPAEERERKKRYTNAKTYGYSIEKGGCPEGPKEGVAE